MDTRFLTRHRSVANSVAAALFMVSITLPSKSVAQRCDFNGDGQSDLAVGSPGDVALVGDGNYGAVHEISINSTFGTFESVGWRHGNNVEGIPDPGDRFGSSLACGNFNGDAFDDLAIGSPGANHNKGYVNVLYGSPKGLDNPNGNVFSQNTPGIDGNAEAGDFFGEALVAGDFNDDGVDDLAIGVPGEDFQGPVPPLLYDLGLVHVLFGREPFEGEQGGLSAVQSKTYQPNLPGVSRGRYGRALTAADFDGDGVDDLAVGAPVSHVYFLDSNDSVLYAGAVHVMFGVEGSPDVGGPSLDDDLVLNQAVLQNGGNPYPGEKFGYSLTTGNFDGFRGAELVIGVPLETLGKHLKEAWLGFGGVHIIKFAGKELMVDFLLDEQNFASLGDGPGDNDGPGVHDYFGFSLTSGDFDGSGEDDLVIGTVYEVYPWKGENIPAGKITIVDGSPMGLDINGAEYRTGYDVISAPPEVGQQFGFALAAGNYKGSEVDDLAVGLPGWTHDLGGKVVANAGAVAVFPGVSGSGLAAHSGGAMEGGIFHQGTVEPIEEWGPVNTDYTMVVPGAWKFLAGERFGHAIGN